MAPPAGREPDVGVPPKRPLDDVRGDGDGPLVEGVHVVGATGHTGLARCFEVGRLGPLPDVLTAVHLSSPASQLSCSCRGSVRIRLGGRSTRRTTSSWPAAQWMK